MPRGLRLEVETAGRLVTRDEGVERSYPAHSEEPELAAN